MYLSENDGGMRRSVIRASGVVKAHTSVKKARSVVGPS